MPGLPEGGVVVTTTCRERHGVVLHGPSARTKYVVVTVGFTVMEVWFVEPGTGVPPQVPLYHFHWALRARGADVMPFRLRVTLSPRQMLLNGLFEVNVTPLSDEGSMRVTLKLHVEVFPEPSVAV